MRPSTMWLMAPLSLLAACSDYAPVHTLADAMGQTTTRWHRLAEDVTETCERGQALSSKPDAEACAGPAAATKAWNGVLKILGDYAGALGATTDDGNFALAGDYQALAASAGPALGFSPAQASALEGIGKVLSELLVDGIRRRSLRRLIDGQTDNAKLIVVSIRDRIGPAYRNILDRERARLNTAYGDVAANSRIGHLPDCTAAGPLPRVFEFDSHPTVQDFYFRQQFTARCADIRGRLAAADRLQASADAMLAAFDSLRTERTRLGSKAAARALRSRARELLDSAEAIRQATAGAGS